MRSLSFFTTAFIAATVAIANGQVRISQIYGAGGNSGALLNSDYVELFNAGATSASLSGYSIQYASSTGSNWSKANIGAASIPAGGYYLLRITVAGANGSAIAPDQDISGTIAMAAGAGKVALVNTQTAIAAGTSCPSDPSVVDFVPYGTAGTGSCPNQSATIGPALAAFRAGGGCMDTDNAANDFTAAAPAPRNASTAANLCGGGSGITLSINDVTQVEGNSGTATFAFTVSLSAAAPAGGVTFDIATADNTATTAGADYVGQTLTARTIPEGSTTFLFPVVVNGDTLVEGNESFFVQVTNVTGTGVTVNDGQGLGTITNDDISLISISAIQGPGVASPLVGSVVSTQGIVTALRSNGYFLQSADAEVDAEQATSEGIFVFTSSAPPAAAAVANRVQVTGTVAEFTSTGNPASFTTTELTGPTTTLLSSGNPLPTAAQITAANLTSAGGLTQLERYEGMLVTVASLTVVAPTSGNVSEPNANSTTNGVFFGVVTGVATPFREAGIEAYLPLPVCAAGSGCAIPVFDANPERIRVDSDGIPGQSALNLATGAVLTNLTGVLDHNGSSYTLYPTAAPTVGGTPMTAAPVPLRRPGLLSLAAMNVERLFDDVNDPSIGDPVVDTTAYNNRLGKISLAIRGTLRSPDVIALEEVENLTVAQALAARIDSDAIAASKPAPGYTAHLVEGNDPGGIDVAFLIRNSEVSVVSVAQLEKDTTYTNPCDGTQDILNDRPPLRLRGTVARFSQSYDFTVFVNHLRSLIDIGDTTPCPMSTTGGRVRAKRAAQANNLSQLIQDETTANPAARIIAVGDFNAFEVNDGYVDTIDTIRGTPAPPTEVANATNDPTYPGMTNLLSLLPASQRYSYNFDGNHQTIDHVLLNPAAARQVVGGGYARVNSDFPETFRGDFARPERYSDHDPVYVFLTTARNVTADATVTRGGVIFNRTAKTAASRVTVRNNSATAWPRASSLVIAGLPDGVAITNADDVSGVSAIFDLPALAPGQSAVVPIEFSVKGTQAIVFTAEVFAGTL